MHKRNVQTVTIEIYYNIVSKDWSTMGLKNVKKSHYNLKHKPLCNISSSNLISVVAILIKIWPE